MSEENVEIVRRAWEASERRDNEAALSLYDPAIEIHITEGAWVDATVYRGIDGVREFFQGVLDAFGEVRNEVDEWIDAGDKVIAMVHSYGRGRRSGAAVDMVQAHLWTVFDRRLWRLDVLPTKAEALEAAGLSE